MDKQRTKDKCVNFLIAFLCVVLIFLVFEISIRTIKGSLLDTSNQLLRKSNLLKSYYPVQFDRFLGWVSKPGGTAKSELWLNKQLNILSNGLRSNGCCNKAAKTPTIIAFGDSMTFGDGVSDNESWPACLEQMSNITILNAGIVGYGLDQIVLYSEMLSLKYKPDIIIVAFIWDDVTRCGLSVRYNAAKPFFELQRNKLILKNSHIHPLTDYEKQFSWIQKIFGYSFFVHSVMIRTFPQYWTAGRFGNVRAHNNELEVGRALLERLATFAEENNIKLVLIKLDALPLQQLNNLFSGLRLEGAEVINLGPSFQRLRKENNKYYNSLFSQTGHFTTQGNKFVASKVYQELKNRNLIK